MSTSLIDLIEINRRLNFNKIVKSTQKLLKNWLTLSTKFQYQKSLKLMEITFKGRLDFCKLKVIQL